MSSQVMMAAEALTEGQTLRLHSADRAFRLEGRIDRIFQEEIAVVVKLTNQEYRNSPQENQTLFGSATGEDCVYRFLTQFHNSTPLPAKIWYISMPEQVQRQQKRKFVRVPILGNLPLSVKFGNLSGKWKSDDVTLFDLSGSGICIVAYEEVPPGAQIAVRVEELPGFGTLEVVATVRRCIKLRVLEHTVYHIGAHMAESMQEGARDRLVQSLFRLQQIYLKKGVGV